MHRTTTTAALLVTVAVSALSGCVTVRHTAAPGPPPGAVPSRQTAPRTDGSASPREVQAPAREALEMVGPSGKPDAREPAPHGSPAVILPPATPTVAPRAPPCVLTPPHRSPSPAPDIHSPPPTAVPHHGYTAAQPFNP
ncbi:hypothetical protein, partial [Streptomyces misionensis]|uniref:hypothetical protein n=1 Tax=Streptomyces misionensis TaxID=67331 RepID=UPI0021BDBF05